MNGWGQEGGWWTRGPAAMALGGAVGAAVGRYLAAPLLARFLGFDPEVSRSRLTALGAVLGAVPGLLHGLTMRKLKGSFWEPSGPPRGGDEWDRWAYWSSPLEYLPSRFTPHTGSLEDRLRAAYWHSGAPELAEASRMLFPPGPPPAERAMKRSAARGCPGRARRSLNKQSGSFRLPGDIWTRREDPLVMDRALWAPAFPVSQAMDDVRRNPWIPPMQSVKLQQAIALAGQAQGVGRTGLASPGALYSAVDRVLPYAAPTLGGAWAASELLGAPLRFKRTMLGGALIAAALNSLTKTSAILTESDKARLGIGRSPDQVPRGLVCRYLLSVTSISTPGRRQTRYRLVFPLAAGSQIGGGGEKDHAADRSRHPGSRSLCSHS